LYGELCCTKKCVRIFLENEDLGDNFFSQK
jgi:hypothetical protein